MITIVGVAHVLDIKEQLNEMILARMPRVVAIELDQMRYHALTQKTSKKGMPLPYRLLAFFQRRIAEKYGTQVGDEMIAAVDCAKKIRANVAFIDMNAAQVFTRMWQMMSFKEKIKLFTALFVGLFSQKEMVETELKRFEEDSERYLKMFGDEFPSIKKVLVDDRNDHMARVIRDINERYRDIVAVIGDGHVDGITELLKDLDPEIIRLKELRNAKPTDSRSVTVSYSFDSQD